jgi:hypothetical protein
MIGKRKSVLRRVWGFPHSRVDTKVPYVSPRNSYNGVYRRLRRQAERTASGLNCCYSVRPDGACHQWRRVPPRELSIGLVAHERRGQAIGRAGASLQRPPWAGGPHATGTAVRKAPFITERSACGWSNMPPRNLTRRSDASFLYLNKPK